MWEYTFRYLDQLQSGPDHLPVLFFFGGGCYCCLCFLFLVLFDVLLLYLLIIDNFGSGLAFFLLGRSWRLLLQVGVEGLEDVELAVEVELVDQVVLELVPARRGKKGVEIVRKIFCTFAV